MSPRGEEQCLIPSSISSCLLKIGSYSTELVEPISFIRRKQLTEVRIVFEGNGEGIKIYTSSFRKQFLEILDRQETRSQPLGIKEEGCFRRSKAASATPYPFISVPHFILVATPAQTKTAAQ